MAFFSVMDLTKKYNTKVDITQLASDCKKCGMDKKSRHPKIDIAGEGRKKILIVGEYSTEEEDIYGTAFAGESGDILRQKLRFQNISLEKDCWRINAVRCLKDSSENNPPSHGQIKQCFPHLKKIMKTLKPSLIILMGPVAITAVYGEDYSDRSVQRWRGYCIPDEVYGCNVFCLHHPSALMKDNKNKNLQCLFDRDLKKAVSCLEKPFLKSFDYSKYVTVLKNFNGVKKLLERILKRKTRIAYDYETTGLKPFKLGHKIATIGVAVSPTKAFAFPYQWKDHWTSAEFKVIRKLWRKILKNNEIKKIAHNFKFEKIWSTVICNQRPECFFDTMMSAHCLDNRSHSIGLKYQTFVRFGVRPYDKLISPYLKSVDGEFNTVFKAPLNELLVYNGLDCIFCYMLFNEQIGELGKRKGLLKAYNFFQKGNDQMATIQLNGICMSSRYYQQAEIDLQEKIDERKKYLEEGREARAFQKMFGKPIMITSNQDLGKLFFEVLGKDPVYTAKGNYKTDKTTLENLKLPFVKKLLEMKKYEKARGTYLGQFAREVYRGKMYPFFDLNIPVSYRGSSSKPNFQNLPKRDKEINDIIRKGIIPRRGCIISETDFSGAEVITSATYHKDPTFIHDITVGDMHRDLAIELFMLTFELMDKHNPDFSEKQVKQIKKIRFCSKNDWTFAQFYGDWFGSCAPMLWEDVVEAGLTITNGITVKDWLEEKGIYELGEIENGRPTPGSFMEHCKMVEEKMWNERFPAYTQWRKDIVKFYQDYGYIDSHFGFRFTGLMNKNQCTNFPIQGASFHLLVHTLIEVQKFISKNNLKTKIIGQVHDSIISDVPENEIQFYHAGINKIVKNLRNVFPWLIIPMEIEVEISKLREDGGNFSELSEVDPDNASLDIWKEAV